MFTVNNLTKFTELVPAQEEIFSLQPLLFLDLLFCDIGGVCRAINAVLRFVLCDLCVNLDITAFCTHFVDGYSLDCKRVTQVPLVAGPLLVTQRSLHLQLVKNIQHNVTFLTMSRFGNLSQTK